MRRTKIVCTIGPASESKENIHQLLKAGMNVARLNFSHGTHAEHGKRIRTLREEAQRLDIHLGILLDTKGPEIRTGMVPDSGVQLNREAIFILDGDLSTLGSSERVGITYAELWKEVSQGTHILLDDGLIDLEVISVAEEKITTRIQNGGILKSKKGVNVPGVSIQLPAITEKDREDILFGLREGIDFIAASFSRKAADILAVRRLVEEEGSNVKIIAKIESREGIDNLDEILEVSDGLMVARGDLGVEVPVEEVPIHQKDMINKCHSLGKPVIVATQMLDSMMRNPRPTRAEASDVANAILDGTDAIMLSGETAAGQYPIEAVEMMNKIALQTEKHFLDGRTFYDPHINIAEAISHASYTIARDLEAAAILTPTHSGMTARMISKFRPQSLIIAATPFEQVARQLSLSWGINPLLIPESSDTDQLLSVSVNQGISHHLIKTGDVVVITAGVPVGKVGTTNIIKVQVIGDVIAKGTGIGRKSYSGAARTSDTDLDSFKQGDILVAPYTDKELISLIAKAGALVVEEGGLTSHGALAALHYGIPTIVGAKDVIRKIKDGQILTVDALAGVVYDGIVSIL
ncbi:pyruvate kinase [Desulfitobacterium dichloroeliminans LMG P-21439]|uniref:Pyruvate kinase n=1 Tax=Desulfitobacterium dichloroeliminans (strain LMG P-21439 / DCA1) TaxID=871963 RepID=L0F8P6_DESDL|nr:pyruvate kinase [Desulfitobacterium dichloroeliminans]AGA69333.1 pyruvate kinase [Desulfitobacterium dichloroeliminans LMG P-21439]